MKQVNPAVDVLDRSVDVASEPDMRAFAEAVRSQWGYVDAVIAVSPCPSRRARAD